jgi:hypothetical protein
VTKGNFLSKGRIISSETVISFISASMCDQGFAAPDQTMHDLIPA